MADLKHFKLPDVGEGLTEAEIVSWKVKPGDVVRTNEIVVEIETAKSLVELPSPYAGLVTELHAPEGATVDVGTPIITVDIDPDGASPAAAAPSGSASVTSTAPEPATSGGIDDVAPPRDDARAVGSLAEDLVPAALEEGAVEPGLIGGPAPGGRTSVLVGYGPRTTEAKRRPRKGQPAPSEPPAATPAPARAEVPASGAADAAAAPVQAPVGARVQAPPPAPGQGKPLAKPPVRKLAKDLGVDLAACTPTGPGGTVTREDVLAVADGAAAASAPAEVATSGRADVPRQQGERETRTPVKGVRKMTAQAMVASAFTAPHVTEWMTVDVTRTMRLVERLRADREFADVKVSPLLLVAKALLVAVRRNPGINASWDEANQEIVTKHYVNLGIAAATPRGLVVPNVKDADRLSLHELAEALQQLTATAREGRTPPADMQGGTISITNVGVFGVDAGTPILNPGEAAILCFGAVRQQPWVHKGKVKPRWVTQLALSFDHRLVDGDLGSRTLADVAAVLEDPSRGFVWS